MQIKINGGNKWRDEVTVLRDHSYVIITYNNSVFVNYNCETTDLFMLIQYWLCLKKKTSCSVTRTPRIWKWFYRLL